MVMDMALINMGCDDKLIPALGEAFGQFPAYPVGVLRGDLSGFERLPDMVCQHFLVAGRLAAPGVSVQLPGQQHFSGGGGRIVSHHHLHGDDRLTRAELAPAVDHRAAQRAVAIEMGGKDKVPVKAGGQFSTLQAGAEQKTVCPARRDRRGA